MGLPFETPGGYQDDDTAPDTGRYDDLTGDYDGYNHDLSGGYEDADEDEFSQDDDFDYGLDEHGQGDQGDQAGWGPGTGQM
jgi:hypothetical protein